MADADVQALCAKLVANKPSFTEAKIDVFNISDEDVDLITSAMKRNTSLEKVLVCDVTLSATAALSLNDALVLHPKLKEISFVDVNFVEFSPIALAFRQNKQLSRLSFEDCLFTETLMENLRFLLKTDALDSLVIIDATLGERSLDLSGSLGCNRSLKEFALKDTYITRKTLRDIPRMMRLNQEIESIDIECMEHPQTAPISDLHNYFSLRVVVPLLIVQAAERHKSLRKLCLHSGDFEEVIVEAVGNMLQNTPSLQMLNLSDAFLGSVGIHPLVKVLRSADNNLVELDLGWNALGKEEATALVEVLKVNRKLKSLSVRDNLFGDTVSSMFSTALRENSTLECFRFDGNKLGPQGTIAIFNALRTNKTLKHISLLDNPIGNDGVASICYVLKSNTTIKRIEIEGFGEQGMNTLVGSLPRFNGLKHLELGENLPNITPSMAYAFANALERNTTLESLVISDGAVHEQPHLAAIMPRVNHLLALNRGGRRILKARNMPHALWPRILGRSSNDPDVLFFFLREEKPDVFFKKKPVTGKRKRDDSDEQ